MPPTNTRGEAVPDVFTCISLGLYQIVQKKVLEIIETHLKNNDYDEDKVDHPAHNALANATRRCERPVTLPFQVGQWISNICESCMEELYSPRKPFK